MAGEADYIKREIEQSDTDSGVKADTLDLIDKSEEILEKIQDDSAREEYKDVQLATIGALKELQLSTSHNLDDFRDELESKPDNLSDGQITRDELGIIRKEFSELQDTQIRAEVPTELVDIADKNFNEYSPEEAQRVLRFLNQNHTSYEDGGFFDKAENTLGEIETQYDGIMAQEQLIDIAYGEGTLTNGFSNEIIVGFSHEEGGNHVRTANDFESRLREGRSFNALMFANYIKYLTSKNGGDITTAFNHIVENCGDRMDRIEAFIGGSNNKSVSLVKDDLINAGLFSEEEGFIGVGIESIKQKGFELLKTGIISLNDSIINGSENVSEILSSIHAILDASVLGYSLSSIIGEGTVANIHRILSTTQAGLQEENMNTQLFRISDLIHDFGENVVPDAFRGNIFEQAHNIGVQELIKKMIETKDVAVSYNTDKGYGVRSASEFESIIKNDSQYIQQGRHRTEVGTYLCSLYKKGENFTPEHLTSVFGEANLFSILSDFKSGDFGGETFNGVSWSDFYSPYLGGFETAMQGIIKETIATSDATQINAIIQGGEGKEETQATLALCPLCNEIDKYNNITDITIALQSEELKAAQPEFYQGLEKKREHINESVIKIAAELERIITEQIQGDIPEGLQDKIGTTAQEVFVFMEEYLGQNPQDICGIDLKLLFISNGSGDFPKSPLVDFQEYIKTNYSIDVSIYDSIDIVVNTGFQTQINLANTNISTAQARIKGIISIPENERSQEQIQELNKLENDIIEWEEDVKILEEKQERSLVLKTSKLIKLNEDTFELLKKLSNNGASNEELEEIIQLYSNVETREIYQDPKKYVGQITHKRELINLLQYGGNDTFQASLKKIQIKDIHPNLRGDILVLRNLPTGLTASDINDIPEQVFLQGGIQGKNRLIGILKLGIEDNDTEVATSLIGNTLRRAMYSNGNPTYGAMIIQEILDGHSFTNEQKSIFLAGIPESYFRILKERGVDVGDNETITEDEFQQRVGELENLGTGLGNDEVSWIIKDIDSYIAQNSVVSMHGDIIKILIEKNYIRLAPNIMSAVVYGKSENQHGEGFYVQYQRQLIAKRASYITYFPSESVSDSSIISTMVRSSTDINHLRQLVEYINFSGFRQLETLYNEINIKYGNGENDIAADIIGSDKRFLEIGNQIINSGISDEHKSFVYEIFLNMTNISKNFQAGKEKLEGKEQAQIEQRIENILNEIGLALFDANDMNKLIDVYTSDHPPVESIGILIEIFGDKEIMDQFIMKLAEVKVEEITTELEQKYQELGGMSIQSQNSPIFQNLFGDDGFNSEGLRDIFGEFIQDNQLKLEKNEDRKDFIARVAGLFFENNSISNEQQIILLEIFGLEDSRTSWNDYTHEENVQDYTEIYLTEGVEAVTRIQRENFNRRIETGNIFASEDEISGEKIFNYDTGKLISNPNYTHPKDTPGKNPSPTSNNDTPSESTEQQTMYEIGGSPESPTITIGEDIIKLDPQEALAMKENPEAMKNFINADKYFQTAGLTSMWRLYRKEIVIAMNMSGGDIQINLNDDSLNKTEFLKFAQYSYKIANGQDSNPSNKITDLQNQFKVYGDIHAEDKSLLGDRFVTDLNTIGINRQLTSGQIATQFQKLAKGDGLSEQMLDTK